MSPRILMTTMTIWTMCTLRVVDLLELLLGVLTCRSLPELSLVT